MIRRVLVLALFANAAGAAEQGAITSVDEATARPAPEPAPREAASEGGEGGRESGGAASSTKLMRIALYDLDISDLPERTARVFTDSLAIEVRKLRAVDVVTMEEIRTMIDVEAQKQLLGCDQQSCLAEIADALGADVIIAGSIATVGGERLLGLQRIDQQEAAVSQRFQIRLEDAGGEELLAAVGPAVETLFPDRALKAGAARGVDESVALRLHPPPLPAWSFWTTAGVGLTSLAGGAVVGALAFAPYAEAQRLTAASAERAVDASAIKGAYDNANLLFLSGQVLAGTGLVVLAAAGAMFFFTDFRGVGDEQ